MIDLAGEESVLEEATDDRVFGLLFGLLERKGGTGGILNGLL
jgi:hypothetical protein